MDKKIKELEEENAALVKKMKELAGTALPLMEENESLRTKLATVTEAPTEHSKICKVAAKLPPFWADRPVVWFAQVEAQFEISGITVDQTKFNYVIAQLDSRVIGEVEDIITHPPPADRFAFLKKELIRRLSTSEEQRVRQLINDEVLGDRRPSQFLRHLRSLAGHVLTDQNILRQLWMRRLPQHLQAILAAQSEISLDKVAELADKILEVSPGIMAPSTAASSSDPSLSSLLKRIEELTQQVAALSRNRDHRGHRRAMVAKRCAGTIESILHVP
ncbi:uncharacterized protein [Maniola hyperantus]|uniref:uncharacterized protein n=1 Tax=Aphantopus hyperantus TaxID=2795564 RepID=UPI00374A854E